MFSTGLSSGAYGGSIRSEMLLGTTRSVLLCQPAPSRTRTAWAPGATVRASSATCALRPSVSARHHQARADAALRTDGTEQVGRGVARVLHGARARASARPDVGQRALLADPGLVLEPDLKRLAAGFLGDHLRDPRGEGFLKSAWAAAPQLGARARTETWRKPRACSRPPIVRSAMTTPKGASTTCLRSR